MIRISTGLGVGVLLAAASAWGAAPTLATSMSVEHGAYLTDAQGRALYAFESDRRGVRSACYDACAKAWPPLITEGKARAAETADAALIGTIERKDGARQLTYNGWPLYRFARDMAPGTTHGQDIQGFGGEWYLLKPDGEVIYE